MSVLTNMSVILSLIQIGAEKEKKRERKVEGVQERVSLFFKISFCLELQHFVGSSGREQ